MRLEKLKKQIKAKLKEGNKNNILRIIGICERKGYLYSLSNLDFDQGEACYIRVTRDFDGYIRDICYYEQWKEKHLEGVLDFLEN